MRTSTLIVRFLDENAVHTWNGVAASSINLNKGTYRLSSIWRYISDFWLDRRGFLHGEEFNVELGRVVASKLV